jgi:hypothetical protein
MNKKYFEKHHTKLGLTTVSPEMRVGHGYNYLVTFDGETPLCAFRTESALLRWMSERGIELDKPLPALGVYSWQRLRGSFTRVSHIDPDAFNAIRPILGEVREMSNGQYTLGKITLRNGVRAIHYLNPNCQRVVFDYAESDEIYG